MSDTKTRKQAEAAGQKILALGDERTALKRQPRASEADTRRAVDQFLEDLKADNLDEMVGTLSSLGPNDALRPDDFSPSLLLGAVTAHIRELVKEAWPLGENWGEHDAAFLEKRTAEIDKEIDQLRSALSYQPEGGPFWPHERIGVDHQTGQAFDAWSNSRAPIRGWNIEGWLKDLAAPKLGQEKEVANATS
jgi:hypothetical protein